MLQRRMTMPAEEAWQILWNASREQECVFGPVERLRENGCSRARAIELIRELSQRGIVLPSLGGTRGSWEKIMAVKMLKEPPARLTRRPQTQTEHTESTVSVLPQEPQRDALFGHMPSPYGAPVSRVVVLVDRDNIMIALERDLEKPRPFPFEEVLRFAARNGGLEAAFFFCPLKTKTEEILLFRRHGFQIVLAQSVKEGKDRVDKALEDVGKLLLKNPDVGTLVILSGDRDFSDLFAFALGNGKRVLQFYVHRQKGVLISTDYQEQIPIPAGSNGIRALTDQPKTVWQAIRE